MNDNLVEKSEFKKCPDGETHIWRELRTRQKKPGPPYEFFMRCTHCTALKVQLVDLHMKENGDRCPKVTFEIISGDPDVPYIE